MDNHIIIVGAGPAGLSLACSLARLGLSVTLIEKATRESLETPAFDGREIAVTHRSRDILEKLNVWSHFLADDISEIKQAKVLNGGSPYSLNFGDTHQSEPGEPLGFILSNHLIRKALFSEAMTYPQITLLNETEVKSIQSRKDVVNITLSNGDKLHGALLVAADSRFSNTRRHMGISTNMHDFGCSVMVCRMQHELPHEHIAFECFHYGETLAVLPLASRYESSVVVTLPSTQMQDLLAQDDQIFNKKITHQFENRYGNMTLISEKHPYPLVSVYANKFYGHRFALVGDAAVGMHPVTAHGFNLGLQGQDYLANEIQKAMNLKQDIGSKTVLSAYHAHHKKVSMPIYLGTNAVVKLFTNDSGWSKVIRSATLRVANNIPLIKNKILHRLKEKDTAPSL